MDDLRLSLVMIGLVVFAVLCLWFKYIKPNNKAPTQSPGSDKETNDQIDPLLEKELEELGAMLSNEKKDASAESANGLQQANTKVPDKLIIFNILAGEGEMFSGPDIAKILSLQGLHFDSQRGIYGFYEGANTDSTALFNLANIVEPGSFNLDEIADFETAGLVVFMMLPTGLDDITAFEAMVRVSTGISEGLGGQLCDERRCPLNKQSVESARDEIIEFQRQNWINTKLDTQQAQG